MTRIFEQGATKSRSDALRLAVGFNPRIAKTLKGVT
jgi:hypothetical protein